MQLNSTMGLQHVAVSAWFVMVLMSAAALSPDKSSLAAEKLKENLRAEGVLEQLVFAVLHHSTQQEHSVSTSSEVDSCDRYGLLPASC